MEAFKKHMRLGTAPTWGGGRMSVFVTVEWDGKKLSITGVEGPTAGGNCKGSCGQIVGSLGDVDKFADGWSAEIMAKLAEVWERWHLNNMRAGSQVQEDWLRANPVTAVYPGSHYEKAKAALAEAGLQPDPDGYSYGSAWKHEDVPADVLAWLRGLPDADKPLPGAWAR